MVDVGIFLKVCACEAKQCLRWTRTIFLHMNERASELNKAFVKITVPLLFLRKPHIFENIVSLIKKLAVKAIEVAEIVRGQFFSLELLDSPCDMRAFFAHGEGWQKQIFKARTLRLRMKTQGQVKLTSPLPCDTLVDMSKPALGRGLGALLGGTPVLSKPATGASVSPVVPPQPPAAAVASAPLSSDVVRRVPLGKIHPSLLQPRKDFAPEALRELADSIKEQGIVQPLIVRESNKGFELIAGERRLRAAQLAGLTEAPVIVRKADDRAVLEMALIENLQRENLNPIEEALGYSQLISQFQLTQEEVSTKVGKSRAVVANALRLLKLPATIQTYVREARLSVGHAKVILGLAEESQQRLAAEKVIKEALNVRQTEGLVAKLQARQPGKTPKAGVVIPLTQDTHVTDLESKIRERLGTKVQLKYKQGKGSVEISFFSDDELERVLQVLGIASE
jgi:ParB family chromosome partitioning protein